MSQGDLQLLLGSLDSAHLSLCVCSTGLSVSPLFPHAEVDKWYDTVSLAERAELIPLQTSQLINLISDVVWKLLPFQGPAPGDIGPLRSEPSTLCPSIFYLHGR